MNSKALITAFVAGFLFSVGLVVSGMTQPDKVIGFLDIFGDWDPALIGVMGGGVVVYFLFFKQITGRPRPVFSDIFQVPTRREITPSLVIGSLLFGAGWGIGGLCPGPAMASLVSGTTEVLTFAVFMFAGMILFRFVEPLLQKKPAAQSEAQAKA